jgi:type II secretory ATPase GspE/PulE/Tfp pilus assembly ATPase PilB-like protein
MTGHLVFSTLHTNDAISAVPRLLDLGIPEYLVAATLEGVLAQRLVRRVCPDCRLEYEPSAETASLVAGRPIERMTLLRGAGCTLCRGTGFRGRLGLFELLTITDDLRDAIAARAPRGQLRTLAIAAGLVPLRTDGWQKVEAGLTTVEEVVRVIQD